MVAHLKNVFSYTFIQSRLLSACCKFGCLNKTIVWMLLSLLFASYASAAGLSLLQAEQLALLYDPVLKAQAQQLQAIEHETLAADVWEDPNIRVGIMDVPTKNFDLNADPETELLLGYQQMLPRGNSNNVMIKKKQAQQKQQTANINLRQREVKMNARKAWLDLYAQQQTENILLSSRQLFSQQLDVSQSLYAAGRSNQQDVLQADLELSLVDDKLQKTVSLKQESAARLAQLLGEADARQPLDEAAPVFDSLADEKILHEQLQNNPAVHMQASIVTMQAESVALAQQKYKPQWGFDLSYTRSDGNTIGSQEMAAMSFMLMFDLPIFTGNFQDQELAASKQMLQAERYMGQDVQLKLTSELEQNLARWQQLTQRLQLYDQRVLNQAQQNAQAALKGYQSGVVAFEALTRARNAELEAQMQRLDLYVEKGMVYAQILYLTAE